MSADQHRLRVNLGAPEFEIEGGKEFVEDHWHELLDLIRQVPTGHAREASHSPAAEVPQESGHVDTLPSTFGEYRNSFPELSDADLLLLAAHYVQMTSAESSFTHQQASTLLKDHDVRVRNPKQVIGRHEKKRRVFPAGQGTFKVSEGGKKFIRGLQEAE